MDENSTGPEKAERAREKAACWHYQHNLAPSPFVAQACSRAENFTAEPSIHLLWLIFSVWLNHVVSSRNSIKTIDFS